jgi:hypothetical protein
MRRSLFLLAFCGLSSSTALGASACACFPFVRTGWDIQDQAKARAGAAHVVVVRVEALRTPPAPVTIGDCEASATVTEVERGRRYTAGDRVRIEVPCIERASPDQPLSRGRPWVEWADLQPGQEARLFLGRRGKARDFQGLSAGPG